MNFKQVENFFKKSTNELLSGEFIKIKFKDKYWLDNFPNEAGVYIVKEKGKICYVGESGCIQGRIKDMNNTKNHSLRRAIGNSLFSDHSYFENATPKRSFTPEIEILLENYMTKHITINSIALQIGRKELEEFIIAHFEPKYNKKSKRKPIFYNFHLLKDITL